MRPDQQTEVEACASTASQIAALCSYVAQALAMSPEHCLIGEAVEGLGSMAQRLSDSLHRVADPNG